VKKRKTTSAYTTFILLLLVALSSFSPNPPNGRTGAPGENTCATCHDSPPAGVQGLVSIEDLPTTVMPNTTYTLTVRTTATMGSPSTGGFQLVALDDNDVNMGDLISTSNDTGTNTAGTGREYMEHRGDKNVNNSEEVSWTFDWVAPATGSGKVNMWASAVLANNNGSTNNDRVVLTSTSATFMTNTPPTVSISKIDNTCFGFSDGSATANATGGTPPYSYLWSNNETSQTISNLTAGSFTVTVSDANTLFATASETINDPTELILTSSSSLATCGLCNGSASVSPSGGTGPYTFLWNANLGTTDTLVDLCVGTYQVTVTDANLCSQVEFIFIESPDPMMFNSTSVVNNTCFGACDGMATISVSGGISPYTFQWDANANNQTTATASNLCSGIYSITVTDASDCSLQASVSITDPTELMLTPSSTDATCGLCNGSTTVDPSGGTAPYTFLWDANTGSQTTPTAVNLCSGVYFVTVTDSNLCSGVLTVPVLSPNGLSVNISTVDNTCPGFCNGIATALPSDGTPPYTFQWDANANDQTTATAINLCGGTYSITVTDSDGCVFESQATINPPIPITVSISITQISAIGLCDATITASAMGGTPPYTYQWDTGQSGNMLTDLCPGNYTLTVSDSNCSSNLLIVIDNISGTLNPILNQSVSLFPNPNNGDFIIEMAGKATGQEWQMDVFDLQGKSVIPSQQRQIDRQLAIRLEDLADGIYLLRLQNAAGVVLKKLVINQE